MFFNAILFFKYSLRHCNATYRNPVWKEERNIFKNKLYLLLSPENKIFYLEKLKKLGNNTLDNHNKKQENSSNLLRRIAISLSSFVYRMSHVFYDMTNDLKDVLTYDFTIRSPTDEQNFILLAITILTTKDKHKEKLANNDLLSLLKIYLNLCFEPSLKRDLRYILLEECKNAFCKNTTLNTSYEVSPFLKFISDPSTEQVAHVLWVFNYFTAIYIYVFYLFIFLFIYLFC